MTMMKNVASPTPRSINRYAIALQALCLLSGAATVFPAAAQVQRSFLNPSFEVPALVASNPANGCYRQLDESQVPGWTTTHPSQAGSGDCTSPGASTGRLLELWRTNFQGVPARDANNYSELNAEASSRIYQNVCLINGEQIAWRFSHRGRGSATVPDVMDFNVGASQPIVRVGTTSNGVFNAVVVSQGTSTPPAAGGNGWIDYNGMFAYGGSTGTTSLGFESISTGSGSNTVGNFLDNIQIQLRPFVEFTQPSSSTPESASSNLPTLRVNGTVFAAFNVTVLVTGGTAVLGTDYATPGNSSTITVNIPAGVYDGMSAASLFALPIAVTQDALIENNETILLQIQAPTGSPAPFLLNSGTNCGDAAQTTWTYTIVDDDANISLVKNAAVPVAVAGQPTQFDVAYTIVVNNPAPAVSANYSLSDTPGLDSDASIVSANYTLNGGAASALAGGGPWTLQPQWRALAAGASDTYVVTVRININRGGSAANDTCAAPSVAGSGLHNSATAVLQGAPDNTAFNANACRNTPTPVWVTLRKQLTGRAIATDQAQVKLLSGGTQIAVATTAGSAAPASASTGLVVLPTGNTMQFAESVKENGTGADQLPANYHAVLACTNATAGSTTGLPSGAGTASGTRQLWTEFTPAAGDDLDCLITNSPASADLSITKTNNASSLVSGAQTTYDIVASNNGPDAVSNAVLRDPAPTGLTGCVVAAPACTATPGSTCPGTADLTIANLQGTGVPIPLIANGGSVTVRLSCTVQ